MCIMNEPYKVGERVLIRHKIIVWRHKWTGEHYIRDFRGYYGGYTQRTVTELATVLKCEYSDVTKRWVIWVKTKDDDEFGVELEKTRLQVNPGIWERIEKLLRI